MNYIVENYPANSLDSGSATAILAKLEDLSDDIEIANINTLSLRLEREAIYEQSGFSIFAIEGDCCGTPLLDSLFLPEAPALECIPCEDPTYGTWPFPCYDPLSVTADGLSSVESIINRSDLCDTTLGGAIPSIGTLPGWAEIDVEISGVICKYNRYGQLDLDSPEACPCSNIILASGSVVTPVKLYWCGEQPTYCIQE